MHSSFIVRTLNGLGSTLLLLAVGGCGFWPCQDDTCNGCFPQGAIPAPVGTYSAEWRAAHAAAAHADGYVLFLADWVGDTTRLSPSAEKRLRSLSKQGGMPTHQIMIQPSEDSQLDSRRQSEIAEKLAELGMNFPIESIVIDEPEALGLYNSTEGLGTSGAGAGSPPSIGLPELRNPF